MREYVISRIIMLIPTLVGISIIAFFLGVLSPGNPAEIALSQGGYEPTKIQIEKMEKELGLDKPYHIQYTNWMKKILSGDFGKSYTTGRDVFQEIQKRFPKTFKLAVYSMILILIFGLGLGIIAAWNKDLLIEKFIMLVLNVMLSFPVFWIGLILILIFSEKLKVLPTSGYGNFKYMILPSITLSLISIATIARLMRASLIAEFGKSYYIAAQTRGLSKVKLIIKNAFPNALIPVLPMLGNFFGSVLGGSVVVESIFAIPGLGSYAIESIASKDFPVLQSYVLVSGLIFVVVNFAVDILGIYISPKVRFGE